MSSIKAEIVADSISESGKRITTFFLVYPRMIHSELMTHRVFSRNAASSRAIPVKKFLKMVLDNPAAPVWWGKNQPGMQAKEELSSWRLWVAKKVWTLASYFAVFFAWLLSKVDLHKQISNRILEPWFYMQTIVTATEFDNFYALRRHKDAQPEIKALADAMWESHNKSSPKLLKQGQWHLPYIKDSDEMTNDPIVLAKYCTARCCRVSYLNHDGTKPDGKKDLALHDRLLADGHMSPFEHAATPLFDPQEQSGNFKGWKQYRKFIFDEEVFKG